MGLFANNSDLTEETAPVRSDFFIDPYPMATTSSRAIASSCSEMLICVRPDTVISWLLQPKNE